MELGELELLEQKYKKLGDEIIFIKKEYEDIQREREALQREREEILKERKALKEDRQNALKPKVKETYYYYNRDTEKVVNTIWEDSDLDNLRMDNGVVFKSESEAKSYMNYIKAKKEASYRFTKEDLADQQTPKFFLYYDYNENDLKIGNYLTYKHAGNFYFKTALQAGNFAETYKKEILKYEFGIILSDE